METNSVEMTMEEFMEFVRESGDDVMISFIVEKEEATDGE